MPEWVYLIAVFASLTAGYFAGFAAGSWKTDRAPTENAWINVRTHSVDANKEIALHSIDMEHEEQMALIERGAFDQIDFSEETELT